MTPIRAAALAFLITLAGTSSSFAGQASAKSDGAAVAGMVSSKLGGLFTPTVSGGGSTTGEAYFQSVTGLTGVQTTSNPGQGGAAAVTSSRYMDVNCATLPPVRTQYMGGAVIRALRCEKAGATVSAVDVQVCTAPNQGGVCSDSSYQPPVALTPGKYYTLAGMRVGVGCNAQQACRITADASTSVGGTAQSLAQQTQAAAAASSPDSMVAMLRTAAKKNDFTGQLTAQAKEAIPCVQQAVRQKATGTYSTCGGATVATISAASSPAVSSTPAQCLAYTTTSTSTTTSCDQTFALTQLTTQSQYSSTATCTVSQAKGGQAVSSCTPAQLAGMTLVGKTSPVCSSGANSCATQSWTEYWVNLSKSTVLSRSAAPYPSSGTCDVNPLSETRTVSCPSGDWFGRTLADAQCTQPYVDTSTGKPTGQTTQMDFFSKPGCGVCLRPAVGVMCYATTPVSSSCQPASLAGCTLKGVTPTQTAGALVIGQQSTYQCTTTAKKCSRWSGPSPSASGADFGIDSSVTRSTDNSNSYSAALISLEIANSTAQGVEGKQDPAMPLIFGGTDMRCSTPTGGAFGSLTHSSCCDINLQRPTKGNAFRGGCTLDEAKLAAARRSKYTTYIGSYCSSSSFFPHRCTQITQTYCAFQGILPRLVQEQGRQQLAQMVASANTGGTKTQPTTFSYYSSSATGTWSPPVALNGVTVRAWQWPSYCADPSKAAQEYLDNPSAAYCSDTLTTWFASCTVPGGCGALPAQPADGSVMWQMQNVNPLLNGTTAVNSYATVSGSCNPATGNCGYSVAALPVGQGGKMVVSQPLAWALYDNKPPVATGIGTAPSYYQLSNMADFVFKGYTLPGSSAQGLPATVRLDYSVDGGQTWTQTTLPTSPAGSQTALADGVTATGGCSLASNLCSFRFTGTFVVKAKPWGGPGAPDCTGFTAGQLSALNFSKMDLSEWLNSVLSKIKTQTAQSLSGMAAGQAAAYEQAFNTGNGSQSESLPSSSSFARVVPAQGFGPFRATLAVSGYWPQTTGNPALDVDQVVGVTVDWGDCSSPETMAPYSPSQYAQIQSGKLNLAYRYLSPGTGTPGQWGYETTHVFPSPDSETCLGNPQKNVTQHVTLTIYAAKSGTHTVSVDVANAWAQFPGEHNNTATVPTTKTVPIRSNAPNPLAGQ